MARAAAGTALVFSADGHNAKHHGTIDGTNYELSDPSNTAQNPVTRIHTPHHIMINQTPPRDERAAMARKRNRSFTDAHDSTPIPSAFAPSLFHHGHTTNMNTTYTTSFSPSPNQQHHNSVGAAAAAVSPFVDRLTFSTANHDTTSNRFLSPVLTLEPVPEETTTTADANDNNFNLSQSSTTSSVTFATSDSSSSVRMDLSDSNNSSGRGEGFHSGGNNAMIGTMVGSVVGCSVGGGPSSISSGSYSITNSSSMGGALHNSFYEQECLPPTTKRARLGCYKPGHVAQSVVDGNSMVASPSPHFAHMASYDESKVGSMKKKGFNSINFKMNIDKSDGRLCCHVCSLEASSNNDATSIAPASSINGHQGHNVMAETPTPPRSHSLLTYFQPTKKQVSSQHHHQHPPKSQTTINLTYHRRGDVRHPSNNLSPCRYCDKRTCITCTRQCEQCRHSFCSFCTKIDYESSVVERILCFECDEYVRRTSHGGAGAGGYDGDCDMMDM